MNLEQYSARIALYVSVYADLLLQRLAAGEALMEVAEKTAYTASDMTGGDFSLTMFGHAVGFMRGSWIHGKQLGEWYDASVFCLPAGVEVPILLKDPRRPASRQSRQRSPRPLAAKCAARRGNRSRNRQRWKWLGSLGRQTSAAERWQRLKLDADECARRGILSGWEDEQNMWSVREMKVSGA